MKEVIVFGRSEPPCSGCMAVKIALDNKGIDYTYKDTKYDLVYAEMCALRVRGIPAVFVDGIFKQGESKINETIQEILS